MAEKVEILLVYPSEDAEKEKFLIIRLYKPTALIYHLLTLNLDELRTILYNIIMIGRPLSTKYRVTNDFLINDIFAAKKLAYSPRKFESEDKASEILMAKRLVVIFNIFREIPCQVFAELKFIEFETIDRISAYPFARIYKLNRLGYSILRQGSTKKPYHSFHRLCPTLPCLGNLKVPNDWLMSELILNLDAYTARFVLDPNKFKNNSYPPDQLCALNRILTQLGRYWENKVISKLKI